MSKHLQENEKWSIFLNAITGSHSIKVQSVTNQEISFTTGDFRVLESLNDSRNMKTSITHAVKSSADSDIQKSRENEYSEQVTRVLSYTGNQIITHLVDSNFLDSHSINMNSNRCVDNISTKIVTCQLKKQGTKTVLFKQEQVNYGFLQSMLKNPKEVAEILIENKPSLTEDSFTGEDSSFGQDVLSVTEIDKNSAEVKFNYGLIKYSIQTQYAVGAPVIYSSNTEEQFVVDKSYLLNYIYEVFPSGVIFTAAANGQLQPIMFQPISNNTIQSDTKTSFDISLDRSGSMESSFFEYKQKINNIVSQIVDGTKNWKISITAFDDKSVTEEFNSINNNIEDIKTYISHISLGGRTHLYDVMHARINNISKLAPGENAVVIIFTDGANNGGSYSNTDVSSLAYNLREVNPQFAMYTMGYGNEYTESFFTDMSSNGGFTHLHLNKLDQIQEFHQYVSTINNCKVVYSFENGAAKFFEQCAAGDIAISSNLVSYGSVLNIAGDSYDIIANEVN